jgi:hypothetical protein
MASGDKFAIPAMAAGFVSMMGKIEKDGAGTIALPEAMTNIGGNGNGFTLTSKSGWDVVANSDGTFSSLSLGDNIYIFAVADMSGEAVWVTSKNSSVPDGSTASESRKKGGFHVGRIRTTAQAYDAGASLTQDIIPNAVWDLRHRPKCDPTGMVEIIPDTVWLDIYLASEDGTAWPDTVPLSQYNATPLTGTEGYNLYYDYARLCRNAGKRLPTYAEMVAAAYGVPQGATGLSGRVNTGQHSDYGFECVSCLNIDQPSGNVYQTVDHAFDRDNSSDGWNDNLNTGKDGGVDHGQWYGTDLRVTRFGCHWGNTAEAGDRCWSRTLPWTVRADSGLRAACDAL